MTLKKKNITNPEVATVYKTYPPKVHAKLMTLRSLIFDTAAQIKEVGELEETLKWGEPSYITSKTKTGSTIRIAWKDSRKDYYSMFLKCTANLVPAFREKYPKLFNFGGNRSIDFHINDRVPTKELKKCIAMALTYHLNKKLDSKSRWKMIEENI